MIKRILHLTLKKEWFDLIANERKKEEYRQIKPYWTVRLFNGFKPISKNIIPIKFDEVHFRNGYRKNNPFMRIEWKGISKKWFGDKRAYAIQLGKILEIKNWNELSDKKKEISKK